MKQNLLKQRRFAPLFWVQFGGALNDNIFKNALIVLVIYQNLSAWGIPSTQIVNVAAGLFILPFFLFSATSGQIADKFEKSRLIRYIKLLEVFIILTATVGLLMQSIPLMLIVLFLLGVQATLFGPLKYGILPQYLTTNELVRGNGLIEMGTFVAILIGTQLGAILITLPHGSLYIITSLLLVSLAGYLMSWWLPKAAPANPHIVIDINLLRQTWINLRELKKNKIVFTAVLAISWFWLYGALLLTQLPDYVKSELRASSSVLALFFGLFSIGIGLGSVLCSKLSRQAIDLSLVLFGAAGMTVFGLLLFIFTPASVPTATTLLTLADFFTHPYATLITICLLGMSVFAGFYTVPLYALIQARSDKMVRSQTIAGNNIMNSLFMVVAAALAITLLKLNFSIAQIFLVLSILNVIAPIYFWWRVPEAGEHLRQRF
jgi:MFS family permease